jgi:hypothetical protein
VLPSSNLGLSPAVSVQDSYSLCLGPDAEVFLDRPRVLQNPHALLAESCWSLLPPKVDVFHGVPFTCSFHRAQSSGKCRSRAQTLEFKL